MGGKAHSPLTPGIQLSLRAAVAAGLAVAVAHLLRFEMIIYAMIGAVIVSDLSPAKTRQLGLQRLAGSVLGATVGALGSQFLPASAWSIGLCVFTAMLLSHLVRLQDAAKLSGYLSGIVMLGYADNAWHYAFDRLLETSLGVAAAILVSFVPKLVRLEDAPPDSVKPSPPRSGGSED